jgi:receptor protein-tyrosine kinase
MSESGRPMHLIERAALRLGQTIGSTAAVPLVNRVELGKAAAAPAAPVTAGIGREVNGASVIDDVALRRAGMIDWTEPGSRAAEEFRIVQTEIMRQIAGEVRNSAGPRANLVMITSALAGEGKSFTTINLAVGMARRGDHRVLLVDVDGRAGSLGNLFGLTESPGLLDLAADPSRNPEDMIVSSAIDGLCFLPCGMASEGSVAETFAGKRMAGVLDMLARRFAGQLILLDAPPCLASSQPHVLAPAVGQTVLVIAAGSTQQGQVEAALELVRASPSMSLLLNKVSAWHRDTFGAYAYHA